MITDELKIHVGKKYKSNICRIFLRELLISYFRTMFILNNYKSVFFDRLMCIPVRYTRWQASEFGRWNEHGPLAVETTADINKLD